jgi:hypothetical protein
MPTWLLSTPTGPVSGLGVLQLIDSLTDWLFAGFLILAVVMVIFAGYQFMSSGGDPNGVGEARKKFLWAAIAIGIGVSAKGLPIVIASILGVSGGGSIPPPLLVTLSVSAPTVFPGDPFDITWVVGNNNPGVTVCTANTSSPTEFPSWISGTTKLETGDTETLPTAGFPFGVYTFTLSCNDPALGFSSDSIAVTLSNPVPVAHWEFDEGSGTTVTDSINGLTGSLNLTPLGNTMPAAAWVAGQPGFGSAIHFDAIDDQVSVPSSGLLAMTNEVSVAAWINPNVIHPSPSGFSCASSLPGERNLGILSRGQTSATTDENYSFTVKGNGINWRPCYDNNSDSFGDACSALSSLGGVAPGVWTHVAAVYERTVISEVYVNGFPVGAAPPFLPDFPLTVIPTPLTIGRGSPNCYGTTFDGAIDNVKIWDVALTGPQVMSEAVSGP